MALLSLLLPSLSSPRPMTSGRAVAASRVLHRLSTRANSSLHVGPNVQLRRCERQPLEHVHVTVLHNGTRAKMIANLLSSAGARVTHFVKEGSQVPDVEGQGVFVNLDCADNRAELLSSLKGADVFVDSSTKGLGMAPKDVFKVNARLIYAAVQEDPTELSAAFAFGDIAAALYGREKTSVGQVIVLADSATRLRRGG